MIMMIMMIINEDLIGRVKMAEKKTENKFD